MAVVGQSQRVVLGIPSGGTNNQALVKNSGTDGDDSWQTLAPAEPATAYQSGYWYAANQRYTVGGNSLLLVVNSYYYSPVYVWSTITINTLGYYVNSVTTAGSVNISLSACTANGLPGAVLASTSATASVSGGVAGSISNTTLTEGWYYFGCGTASGSLSLSTIQTQYAPILPCGEISAVPAIRTYQPHTLIDTTTSAVAVDNPTNVTVNAVSTGPAQLWFRVA